MRILSGVLLVATAGAATAAAPPAGSSYQLRVTTSFEAPFNDCWTFSPAGNVIRAYASNLGRFPYQLDNLNTAAGNWQAVWRGNISIGFSGTVSGNTVAGNAVDSRTRTYSITGTEVASCTEAVRLAPGAGFRTAR